MASSPARGSSDVDFADVFGGPPRRSAVYERGRSRADSLDSSSFYSSHPRGAGGRGDERRSSGLGMEKPVFGEAGSPAGRRRNLAEDFFDDIFPGSDSGCSTPRKVDSDVLSSTPGSRVLSPNRLVSVGGSLLPARLSFPVKMAKGVEHLAFSSTMHRFPFKNEDDASDVTIFSSSPSGSPYKNRAGNAGRAFHSQSPLAGEFSHVEASSVESQSQKDANSLESYVSSNKFHFSIYRWAGKGVSLSFPDSKEGNGDVSRLGRLAEVVIQAVDLPSDDDNMSTATGGNLSESQDYSSPNAFITESNGDADSTFTENIIPADMESMNSNRSLNEKSGMKYNSNEEVSVATPDMKKNELRSLHHLFNDDGEEIGNEEPIRQAENAEGFTGGLRYANDVVEAKKQAQGEEKKDYVSTIKFGKQEAPATLEAKMRGSKVKGKVKEFIRIFSQEGSPKRKATFETGDRKSKGKDRLKSKVEEQVGVSVAQAYEEVKTSYTNKGASTVISPEVNETTRESVIPDSSESIPISNESSSERDISSKPSSVPTQESINLSASNMEESHIKDPEECLVEQLPNCPNELLQTVLQQDQIKIADSKIREWSKGKENNIRSLLSTLQYVLWPESGWKPVPLVNIIEGTSVKRAYQKALLCLHPDKLQQRGADVHQKYIAEKVFDILQESWDQFNAVSVL